MKSTTSEETALEAKIREEDNRFVTAQAKSVMTASRFMERGDEKRLRDAADLRDKSKAELEYVKKVISGSDKLPIRYSGPISPLTQRVLGLAGWVVENTQNDGPGTQPTREITAAGGVVPTEAVV